MSTTETILAERGATHGWFPDHALVTQAIFDILTKGDALARERPKDLAYDHVQREGLHMIAYKLGRIAAGDPDEPDHWADIAGYARLVADHLERQRARVDTSLVDGAPEWAGPSREAAEAKLAREPGFFAPASETLDATALALSMRDLPLKEAGEAFMGETTDDD